MLARKSKAKRARKFPLADSVPANTNEKGAKGACGLNCITRLFDFGEKLPLCMPSGVGGKGCARLLNKLREFSRSALDLGMVLERNLISQY